jgi:hypothetical protein
VSKKFKKEIPIGRNLLIQGISLPRQGISFSFKYFQENHDKFSIRQNSENYWIRLLERLKSLSSLSAEEILLNRSKALRCHSIQWEDTSESCFGIPNEAQLVGQPYQFSLSSNEYGRVHGFFIEEVFYIVWLDPNHLLYSAR